jgi:hypothetical protein
VDFNGLSSKEADTKIRENDWKYIGVMNIVSAIFLFFGAVI